jgi:hypothetical protein
MKEHETEPKFFGGEKVDNFRSLIRVDSRPFAVLGRLRPLCGRESGAHSSLSDFLLLIV